MEKSLHTDKHRVFLQMLRRVRTDSRVTQAHLAQALDMHQADISKVERGVRRLDVIELHAWLDALGASFVDFAIELDQEILALTARYVVGRRRRAKA